MRGRPLSSQCQEMVISLLEYFQAESENGGPLLPVTAVRQVGIIGTRQGNIDCIGSRNSTHLYFLAGSTCSED